MRWAYRSRVTHAPRRPLGRNVIALGVVSLLTDVSSEIIYPLLPLFLTSVLGVGPGAIGAIEGAAETTAALLKLASGWWSDRVSRRKPLIVAGYSLAAVARPLVAIAQSATQVLAIRVSDRVGKGIRNAPRDALIAESVDPSIRGRAFGFHRAMDNAGGVLGPLIAFAVLTWHFAELRTVFWLAAIPAVLSLRCTFRLTLESGGVVLAEGALEARLVRDCVVSLEPFETAVAERFRLRFVPAELLAEADEDALLDPDADDEIPYDGAAIDLGEAAAEQLALAMDPYPRRPGAALPDEASEAAESPFAALSRLRREEH